jgi:hypothetical protein
VDLIIRGTARPPITFAHYCSAFAVDEKLIGHTTLFSLASLGARDDGTFILEFKIARAYLGTLARSPETVGAQAFSDPMVSR